MKLLPSISDAEVAEYLKIQETDENVANTDLEFNTSKIKEFEKCLENYNACLEKGLIKKTTIPDDINKIVQKYLHVLNPIYKGMNIPYYSIEIEDYKTFMSYYNNNNIAALANKHKFNNTNNEIEEEKNQAQYNIDTFKYMINSLEPKIKNLPNKNLIQNIINRVRQDGYQYDTADQDAFMKLILQPDNN